MIQEFVILLNGRAYLGESNETYRGGDTWSSNSFHTKNVDCNELVFGEDGKANGYIITGNINLLSHIQKITKYCSNKNIGIRSLDILCATCGGSGGVEIGEFEIDSCPSCSTEKIDIHDLEHDFLGEKMIIATTGKIVVTANEQDNLPEWMTPGNDYILDFDGLGGCNIVGDDGITHKCETVKHVLHLPGEEDYSPEDE